MKEKYGLPFPKKYKIVPENPPKGKYAHENWKATKYAIDFSLPEGAEVIATRRGKVVELKNNSKEWGTTTKYVGKANYVTIEHNDETYTEYVHLGYKKIVVKIGEKVKKGQLLGYIGYSGCMTETHLHFNVFESKSIKTNLNKLMKK